MAASDSVQNGDTAASNGISADDISAEFRPKTRSDLATLEIDGELVVAEPSTGQTYSLDSIGTVVWRCFDGSVDIDQLSRELSDAFNTDPQTVKNDVIELARGVGRVGLLAGVEADKLEPYHDDHGVVPEGLPVGAEFPSFELPDLYGNRVALDSFYGAPLLVVNWSPWCGFCEKIAPELATLHPMMAAENLELVLVALGNEQDNRQLMNMNSLECPLVLQEGAELDAFPGMATPVAYLLDEQGVVAAPLAFGSDNVLRLARHTLGLPEWPDDNELEATEATEREGDGAPIEVQPDGEEAAVDGTRPKFIAEPPSS